MKHVDVIVRIDFLLYLKRKRRSFYYLEEILINHKISRTISDDDTVKCTPRKGDWMGGDDILMVIPKLDRRKGNWLLPLIHDFEYHFAKI